MVVRAVTFDCAQTLIEVDWRMGEFAVACAGRIGLALPPNAAISYGEVFKSHGREFLQINQLRSESAMRSFHIRVAQRWLESIGVPDAARHAVALQDAADELAYGPDSILFKPYPEVHETIAKLSGQGLRIAVLSNWDTSLHRVLRSFNLSDRIEFAQASLEEGVEKPESRFFEIALERLGLPAHEVLHVGDSEEDDVRGAQEAGMHAVLIDRTRVAQLPSRINRLTQVVDVIAWTE